jgi:UDP-glucose 4-epimerase
MNEQLRGKRVLVTGGAGFIGSHLVDALSGSQVIVIDDLSTGHRANLAAHEGAAQLRIVEGDIRDRALVDKLMQNVDVVYHLACRGVRHSIGNPRESHEVNASGTLTLLESARAARVGRFVHVSSSEVYGTARYAPMDEGHPCFPETVYGGAKLAGEAYARAYHQTYGMPTVVVRPFNNFGPRSHFEGDSGEVIPRFAVWALCGRQPVIFGDGQQTRDFIYVTETADWLTRIGTCDRLVGKTVNLGSGIETSVNELAELVAHAAGRPDLKPLYDPPRPGDVRRLLAQVDLAKELLQFKVHTTVEQGIGKLLEYLRARPETPEQLATQIEQANWKLQPVG